MDGHYVWTTEFIGEIQKRPGMWNASNKSRDLQKRLWEELSELYSDKSVDTLKRKFNKLKARFRQELSSIPQTNGEYDVDPRSFESDWPYYRQMMFLLNEIEIETKPEKRKVISNEENAVAQKKHADEDSVAIPQKFDDLKNIPGQSKQAKDDSSTEIEVKPDIFPSSDDSLYHFLMGLYDCLSELDPIRRINVQSRMYLMLSQEATAAANSKST